MKISNCLVVASFRLSRCNLQSRRRCLSAAQFKWQAKKIRTVHEVFMQRANVANFYTPPKSHNVYADGFPVPHLALFSLPFVDCLAAAAAAREQILLPGRSR